MSVATLTHRRALRPPQAAQKLGIGLSTLWTKVKVDPDFAQPVKMGPRVTIFFEDELDAWLTSLATKARSQQAA